MQTTSTLRVLVVGATGGSGRAAVRALLARGHEVTAFSRHADQLPAAPRLERVSGDATNPADVDAVVHGKDAVIVTLGITENPLRVRLLGPKRTPMAVRSEGTRVVVDAMRRHGVKRLIVQSSYGIGETRSKLRFIDRVFFELLLKPQMHDTERQEQIVRESALDWVIAQPVHLSDKTDDTDPLLSTEGKARRFGVTRDQVGRSLASWVDDAAFVGQSVAVSG